MQHQTTSASTLAQHLGTVLRLMECLAGATTERRSGIDRRQRVVPLVFADGDQRSGIERRRAA
jgi:hypothetical protein